MNDIDSLILERLVRGESSSDIATELDIPLDWVLEFKCAPTERFVDDRLSGQSLDGMN